MIPTVLGVSRIVFGHSLASAYWASVLPSGHSSILKWKVGIHVFCRLCRMFLRVVIVVVICRISEVWFLRLLLDRKARRCCQTSHPHW